MRVAISVTTAAPGNSGGAGFIPPCWVMGKMSSIHLLQWSPLGTRGIENFKLLGWLGSILQRHLKTKLPGLPAVSVMFEVDRRWYKFKMGRLGRLGNTQMLWTLPSIPSIPSMPTQVCVYNSAPILRGQHFRVKIVDDTWLHTGRAGLHCWKQTTHVRALLVLAQEAHHLQGDGFHTSLIRDGITADLEAEFTATFGGESSDDLDYLYSFQKAVPWRLSPCMKRILKDTT